MQGSTVNTVPKDGESFADTLERGVALGKQRQQNGTQQQAIDKEAATIPTKAAQTLGAAATTGLVGPALLALPGELSELAIKHLAGNVLPGMEEEAAKAKLAEMAPKALQIIKEWALPVSAVGGLLKGSFNGRKQVSTQPLSPLELLGQSVEQDKQQTTQIKVITSGIARAVCSTGTASGRCKGC